MYANYITTFKKILENITKINTVIKKLERLKKTHEITKKEICPNLTLLKTSKNKYFNNKYLIADKEQLKMKKILEEKKVKKDEQYKKRRKKYENTIKNIDEKIDPLNTQLNKFKYKKLQLFNKFILDKEIKLLIKTNYINELKY